MTEHRSKTEKEVKAMQSEIKKNIQEANSKGKETGTYIKDLEQKEEINVHPEQNEETRIQKNEERLRNFWDNFKHPNIRIIGVPEEEGEQETGNLFENIMKTNFPNMANKIDFQEVQEAQSPKEVGPKEEHTKTIIITSPKMKDKERILKSRKRKGDSYLQRSAQRIVS